MAKSIYSGLISVAAATLLVWSTPSTTAKADIFDSLNPALADTSFLDKASIALEKKLKEPKYKPLVKLYQELFYVPVWVGKENITPFAKDLLNYIKADKTLTADMPLYQEAMQVRKFLGRVYGTHNAEFEQKIEAELKMSRLYMDYANYIIYGGIDWNKFDKFKKALSKKYDTKVGWDRYKPSTTPIKLIADSTINGDLKSALKSAEPTRFKYKSLKKYLTDYIQIEQQGGWAKLPKFKSIKPGKKSKFIPQIRKHLQMEGDLRVCSEAVDMDSQVYDKCMQKAIKRFKIRHGLKGTAIIDKNTQIALNIPVEKKIAMIRLNLDRIKWFWHKQAQVRIELNIPAFRLYFYDDNDLVNTIRVITGKPNHPTPIFHDVMEYIVVNPYWKIPQSIVKKEMLSKLIRDPYYYERRGKILHKTWSEDSPVVDPGSVNWSQYRGKKPIPYYFMQVPSSRNALGKIKFLFPNHYSVYIHDTPTKKLFFKNQRAYSHGCMRIQKPRELLKTLSIYNGNIDVEEIMDILTTTQKKTIVLQKKVPVDIVYMTAFVDDYGNINFRQDVYGYDKAQFKDYKYLTINRVPDTPKYSVELTKPELKAQEIQNATEELQRKAEEELNTPKKPVIKKEDTNTTLKTKQKESNSTKKTKAKVIKENNSSKNTSTSDKNISKSIKKIQKIQPSQSQPSDKNSSKPTKKPLSSDVNNTKESNKNKVDDYNMIEVYM